MLPGQTSRRRIGSPLLELSILPVRLSTLPVCPFRGFLDDLHAAAPLVAPSLLACDFAQLGEEIRRVEQAGAKRAAPGHHGRPLRAQPELRPAGGRGRPPLDRSAAGRSPDDLRAGAVLRPFREAGADLLTIHVEAVADPRPLLEEIRALGAGAGISLNPPTPVDALTAASISATWCW